MRSTPLQEYPIYHRLRDRADGFTLAALDGLLRDAWVAGFEAGVKDVDPEVRALQERARRTRELVQRVIGGHLIHISRRLREPPQRTTTIAAERKYMDAEATALDRAVSELRQVEDGS